MSSSNSKKTKQKNRTNLHTKIFSGLYLLALLIFAVLLFVYNFLVLWQRIVVMGLFAIIGIALFFLGKLSTGWRSAIPSALSFLVSLVLILGSFYLIQSFSAISKMVVDPNEAVATQSPEEKAKLHDELTQEGFELAEDFIIEEKVEVKEPEGESFTVYISGIDRYGSIGGVSRTDVNLIMNVNPVTNQILTTTIPRDSYVKIAGGGQNQYDKLTHSGIYGVKSSVETLENLFDIDINYYIRVNFTSLVEIVDVLGGIDVENDFAFTSRNGQHFPTGTIHLNGEESLAFARERYNLPDGDFGRGRNHVKVLEAIIRKGMTPQILLNFGSVMNIVSEAAETNMPQKKITELVNKQIEKNPKWDFESTQIKGTGSTGQLPSYAMPGFRLYMYELDDQSVNETIKQMQAALVE